AAPVQKACDAETIVRWQLPAQAGKEFHVFLEVKSARIKIDLHTDDMISSLLPAAQLREQDRVFMRRPVQRVNAIGEPNLDGQPVGDRTPLSDKTHLRLIAARGLDLPLQHIHTARLLQNRLRRNAAPQPERIVLRSIHRTGGNAPRAKQHAQADQNNACHSPTSSTSTTSPKCCWHIPYAAFRTIVCACLLECFVCRTRYNRKAQSS